MSRSDDAADDADEAPVVAADDAPASAPAAAGDDGRAWFQPLDDTRTPVRVPDRERPAVSATRLPGSLAAPGTGWSPQPADDGWQDQGHLDQRPVAWDDDTRIQPTGRSGALRPVLVTALVLLIVAAAYVAAAAFLAGRVPFNTSIAGVALGGQSRDDAVATLAGALETRVSEPVDVTVGTSSGQVDPSAAGLVPDPEAAVDDLTRFSLAPASVWRHLVGAGSVDLPVTVDQAALDRELSDLASQVDVAPVDGDVLLTGARAQPVAPVPGLRLDTAAAADVLRRQWLVADGPIELPTVSADPAVLQPAVDAAMAQAPGVLNGDLVVEAGGREVTLPPTLFADALDYVGDDTGGLVLTADGAALKAAVLARDPGVETPPVDAQVVLRDGAPTVVPAVPGVTLDVDELGSVVVAALTGDRRAVLTDAVAEPSLTTEAAQALGITQVVSTFSTPYPNTPARTENLRIATATINGMIIKPGETFSLNAALGERTLAKGYREAGVIENGRFTSDVGGGVSQVSTTTYNAAFFAGYDDVAHTPHSFYISRYPEGREATLNWDPPIEMKFTNNTPYGTLIQAGIDGGQVTVTFWSTPYWEVESQTSPRTNPRTPTTVYDTSADCEAHESLPGFDVTVTRIWKQGGAEVKRESKTVTYLAADKIICGPRPE